MIKKICVLVLFLLVFPVFAQKTNVKANVDVRLLDAVLGIESYMKTIADWEESPYDAVNEAEYGAISEKSAFDSYKKLADSGDVRAKVAVSYCYENALGVKKSRASAMTYLEKAMEELYAPAISSYCELVMKNSSFTTTDAKVVSQILANSLSKKYVQSYIVLAECYRIGFGVKSDNKIAIDLLEKAKKVKGANIAEIDGMIADIYLPG